MLSWPAFTASSLPDTLLRTAPCLGSCWNSLVLLQSHQHHDVIPALQLSNKNTPDVLPGCW
jgi:hypothetical protein